MAKYTKEEKKAFNGYAMFVIAQYWLMCRIVRYRWKESMWRDWVDQKWTSYIKHKSECEIKWVIWGIYLILILSRMYINQVVKDSSYKYNVEWQEFQSHLCHMVWSKTHTQSANNQIEKKSIKTRNLVGIQLRI